MDSILQGTTPALTIGINPADFSVSNIVELEFAVQQKNNITLYNLADVTIDPEANTVTRQFTEAETLAFVPNLYVSVQLRFWFPDGSIIGTKPISIYVDDLLSEEVTK